MFAGEDGGSNPLVPTTKSKNPKRIEPLPGGRGFFYGTPIKLVWERICGRGKGRSAAKGWVQGIRMPG